MIPTTPRTYTIDIEPVTSRSAASAFFHHINIALSYFEVIEPIDLANLRAKITAKYHPHDTTYRCLSSTIDILDHIYSEPDTEDQA